MKIYTKTGDNGTTSIYGGTRLPKSDLRLEAIGSVDELNAHLGLLRDQSSNLIPEAKFQQIQENLFVVGALLASEGKPEKIPNLPPNSVEWLEEQMDKMDEELPEMRFFILPGGHPIVSQAHITRCVCRRAERQLVRLAEQVSIASLLFRYLNRLSDYLFVLARYLGKKQNVKEIPWRPNQH
ncbi:MAG: cob(I)yrinic acid a,c-diamide adenosyltransferase [Cyclobacteriaceae bacterium]